MLDTSLAEIEVVDDSAQFFAPTNTDLSTACWVSTGWRASV